MLILAFTFCDGCEATRAEGNPAPANLSALSANRQVYTNANHGFQCVLPQGWTARETSFYIYHYSYEFLTINSQRPDFVISPGWSNPKPLSPLMQPGEVYITFCYAGGPGPDIMRPDTVGEDLQPLLATDRISPAYETGLSHLDLNFFKRGRWWNLSAWLRDPVTEDNRQKVLSLFQSFRFIDAPVGNAAWAESLAWKALPEKIRGPEDGWRGWPVAGEAVEKSAMAEVFPRAVCVTNSGSTYSVKFALRKIGEWSYWITTNGEVEAELPIIQAESPPPSQWPSDLPDAGKGAIDASWIAPYVQASKAFGKTTITWFAHDGLAERQATVSDADPASGFVRIIGHRDEMAGINDDWHITLRAVVPPVSGPSECFAKSTPDSRVFVYQYNSQPGMVEADIYIHGKRVNTIGPYFPKYPSPEVVLNDDGSAGLIIAKTNVPPDLHATGKGQNTLRDTFEAIQRIGAQIVALNTNGEVRFKTDCGNAVWSPLVAPNGAGALLRPNTGTNQNTFMWFTEKGEICSLDISPNPQFVGWIPQSCNSAFMTQLGFETTHIELIDWNAGKVRWDIPFPGGGEVLAIGLTPKLIIFSVAEPYPAGIWHEPDKSLLQSGQEWVRTFYAVDAQYGKLVARWRGQFPHRYFDANRDYFLQLDGKFFYVTAEEFTELNLKDIIAKEHGWN